MTTPKKEQIVERARELFHSEQWRRGIRKAITPEYSELLEGGYVACARSELMTSEKRKYAENDFVDFAESFDVDLKELFQSNALILGSRGTGKSDLGMLIAERCDDVVVIFDPSQDWIQRSSIKQYLKVKSYRSLDVPKESIIYDLSLCSPLQAQKIVEDFSKKLFESQARAFERKQYLVIFEEAHTYFYEGSMRSKKMQNCVKLLSVGRNIDIAVLLISQFASMLSKFAVKHAMSQSWLGFSREPNDLRYLRMILGETSKQLPKLNDGEFLYLTRSGLSKIQIEPFNANIRKTEIKIPELQLKPIESIKLKENNAQAISSLFSVTLWFLAIVIVLNSMW